MFTIALLGLYLPTAGQQRHITQSLLQRESITLGSSPGASTSCSPFQTYYPTTYVYPALQVSTTPTIINTTQPHPLYYPSLSTHTHSQHHHGHTTTATATAPSDPRNPAHPNHNPSQPSNNNPSTTTHHQHLPPARTPLTVLAADEAVLAYRKRAVARYGASWLRPPGVSKTLQGRDDERAEREEVEAQREREARAEEEMMRAQELADAQEGEEGGEGGEEEEEEEEAGVDLDAEVPDADAGGEWSDDEGEEDEEDDEQEGEEEEEEQQEEDEGVENGENDGVRRGMGMGMRTAQGTGMGVSMFDGPATPLNDDRTPQRFRLNPFQAPTAEGDGDYGSPLAARHSQRAAAARARDVSPGVLAAVAVRRGHVDAAVRGGAGGMSAATPNTGVIDMEADLDDAIPMDETMMEGGSYEHTDTGVEDLSSEDEGVPGGGLAGVGSRSVFGGGGIAAAVRRLSGQDRRASGVGRRVSGETRVSGGRRRTSGRGRGHPGREN